MSTCYSLRSSRFLLRIAASTLLALAWALGAAAQPRPADLVRSWRAHQRQALDRGRAVVVDEFATRTMDGASGTVEAVYEGVLSGTPNTREWNRSLRSVTINGRALPESRQQRMGEDLFRQFGLPRLLLAHAPDRVLRELDAPRTTTASDIDGTPAWRLDFTGTPPAADRPGRGRRAGPPPPGRRPRGMRPGGPPPGERPEVGPMIERYTLWFSRTEPVRLLRTRAILTPPFAAEPMVAVAEYTDFDGMDVVSRIEIEGQIRQRRRARSFTVLLDAVVEYRNYRYLDNDSR